MCVGLTQHKTHGALPRHTANGEHTIGAMAESSGKFKLQARTETEAVFSYMVQ